MPPGTTPCPAPRTCTAWRQGRTAPTSLWTGAGRAPNRRRSPRCGSGCAPAPTQQRPAVPGVAHLAEQTVAGPDQPYREGSAGEADRVGDQFVDHQQHTVPGVVPDTPLPQQRGDQGAGPGGRVAAGGQPP